MLGEPRKKKTGREEIERDKRRDRKRKREIEGGERGEQ